MNSGEAPPAPQTKLAGSKIPYTAVSAFWRIGGGFFKGRGGWRIKFLVAALALLSWKQKPAISSQPKADVIEIEKVLIPPTLAPRLPPDRIVVPPFTL